MSNKSPTKITLASIAAQREALAAQMAALATQEAEIATEQTNKLGEFIDNCVAGVSKLLGRDIKADEFRSLVKQRETGTLGKLSVAVDTTKKLTPEQHAQVVALLVEREDALKAGSVPVNLQISTIAAQFGVSAQTIQARKEKALAVIAARTPTVAATA